MHTQHANMHNIPTCDMQCNMPLCRHNMHVRSACALQPPGTAQRSKFRISPQGNFPPHVLGKDFEVAEKASPHENKYKGGHSQPAKGPGVCCIRYQGCTHVWQFPRTVCRNRLGKVMLIAVNFADLEPLYLFSYITVLHGQLHSQISIQINLSAIIWYTQETDIYCIKSIIIVLRVSYRMFFWVGGRGECRYVQGCMAVHASIGAHVRVL